MVGRHRKHLLFLLTLIGAIIVAMLMWRTGPDAERRAVLRMQPEERRHLYEQSRTNAEALCAEAAREVALLERCEDAVEFLLVFPECDAPCQELARAHHRAPTR